MSESVRHTAFSLLKHIGDKDLRRIGYDVAHAVKAADPFGMAQVKSEVEKTLKKHD